VNAFALPGGQVFITRALYDKLSDEAMLSGVLGHEIGHVVDRHSAQQMAKGQLGQMVVSGVAGGDQRSRSPVRRRDDRVAREQYDPAPPQPAG
jgi:predicted Zn-dependent protease